MLNHITVIFPHQLFTEHPALQKNREVVLIEHPLLFGTDSKYPMNMHRQKLTLHRASMKAYQQQLTDKGYDVTYLEFHDKEAQKHVLNNHIHAADPTDFLLEKWLQTFKEVTIYPNPNFINSKKDNAEFFGEKKKFFMKTFYEWQRRRLNILIDNDGNPEGGKFSFDAENRKKLPAEERMFLPEIQHPSEDKHSQEAMEYIHKHFPNNYGEDQPLLYPWNHHQAEQWLQLFIKERLEKFGPYEDAIEPQHPWLFHSMLTPMLNIGLVTPGQVVTAITSTYKQNPGLPVASIEGFIRQIIGWREFMRHSYQVHGVTMRTSNHWNHNNSMPASFYNGTTGIEPIDTTIKHILKTGYCHHIERLMVLGGFMFLCEIHPKEIYKWFSEMFIDSYDWVMVPNVYAMSQNSAGGLITTKPYFSGSSYIKKMSSYQKGNWCEIWDGLYWRFINKHHAALQKNHRWSMMCAMLKKMEGAKRKQHITVAERFLATVHCK